VYSLKIRLKLAIRKILVDSSEKTIFGSVHMKSFLSTKGVCKLPEKRIKADNFLFLAF
jgi:hypothetical protein